jgi:hypothetical protein
MTTKALRPLMAFVVALTLAFGALVAQPEAVGAYNGAAYSNASSACGPNAYCTVQFQSWGGADQWDQVQVILYMWCNGNYSYSWQHVGVTNGTWQVYIWLASGCYSSYAEVRYYDWAGNVYHFPRW